MKKLRRQKALDPLTPAEREALARELHDGGETYDEAIARLSKPRAEGGFDLRVSRKPLQTLRERYTQYRLLTAHSPQKITFKEYELLQNGEPVPFTQVAQYCIQKTACEIVSIEKSDLKPIDLLKLSRVLNIPLQQKYTEHKMQMDRRRAAAVDERNAIARLRVPAETKADKTNKTDVDAFSSPTSIIQMPQIAKNDLVGLSSPM
jgi:hypothetical protein